MRALAGCWLRPRAVRPCAGAHRCWRTETALSRFYGLSAHTHTPHTHTERERENEKNLTSKTEARLADSQIRITLLLLAHME